MERALMVILGFVIAGVVLLAGAALVLTLRDDEPFDVTFRPTESDFTPVTHDPDAALDLIEAWTRWRTGTFVTMGTWTRTLDSDPDGPLVGEVYLAQDPPRRYSVRLGGVVDRSDDDEATYERVVSTELALVGGYVRGDGRLYDVAGTEPGCFQAELIQPVLASPWGRWAEYCFDETTGALTSATVRRQSAFDVERITTIRTDVSDADFG